MVDPLAEKLPSLNALHPAGSFAGRHIGPRADDTAEMLSVIGHPSLAEREEGRTSCALVRLHPG